MRACVKFEVDNCHSLKIVAGKSVGWIIGLSLPTKFMLMTWWTKQKYILPTLHGYYRYAKAEIRAVERERKAANIAKQHHEFKIFRIEREKQEKAAKHQQKRAELDTVGTAAIAAAVERVQAKKVADN